MNLLRLSTALALLLMAAAYANDTAAPEAVEDLLNRLYEEELALPPVEIDRNPPPQSPCDDATAQRREAFVRKLMADADDLQALAREYDRKAREIFARAERQGVPFDLKPGTLWARGKFYWDWAGALSDMAEDRRRRAQQEWREISEDYALAAEAHELAGRWADAERCYLRGVNFRDPWSVKPWLIDLPDRFPPHPIDIERGLDHQRTMELLRKAAAMADKAGETARAASHRLRAAEQAEEAAKSYERGAKFWDNLGIPEEGDEWRAKARALREG